jgi:hypothetical protein
MERDLHTTLDSYIVRVGAVAFHPLGFSLSSVPPARDE